MITIRREQWEKFKDSDVARFEVRAIEHLQRCFPELYSGTDTNRLAIGVHMAIEKSAEYGITGQRDIIRFLDCMVVLGVRFDETYPWAVKILLDRKTPSIYRMNEIWRHLRELISDKNEV